MNVIDLLHEIKGITFKFEDQKYKVLSIHNAKTAFYCFRQHSNISNSEYLERFGNLADIATSLDGNLHDDAISRIVSIKEYAKKDPRYPSLEATEVEDILRKAKKLG